MAAAKKKRSPASRRDAAPSGSRGLGKFLAGAITGALVTWVMVGHDPTAEQVRATVERTVGHSIGIEPAAPPPKPKFEFYTLLPEMEVVVPDEDLPPPGPAPVESDATDDDAGESAAGTEVASTSTAQTTREDAKDDADADTAAPQSGSGHYILQVASFRSMQEADGLKAQLTLLGFSPVVQTIAIDSEKKWHRVRIGPYADRNSLEAARARLQADGHGNSLVVWVKKG